MSELLKKLFNNKIQILTNKINEMDISNTTDWDFCCIIRLIDMIIEKKKDTLIQVFMVE